MGRIYGESQREGMTRHMGNGEEMNRLCRRALLNGFIHCGAGFCGVAIVDEWRLVAVIVTVTVTVTVPIIVTELQRASLPF